MRVRQEAVTSIYISPQAKSDREIRSWFETLKGRGTRALEKPKEYFDKLGSGHQGVAVEVSDTPTLDWKELERPNPCILLALDEIEDPHNLGAILRSAWLLGVKAVLIPEMRSASLTPTVHKVASGAVEHVPVVVVKNLADELKSLKEQGFWIYGLAGEGSMNLFQLELNEKVCWVIGSEGTGLRTTVSRACDELVSIPQVEVLASFNASVAAGIALAESYRQLLKDW